MECCEVHVNACDHAQLPPLFPQIVSVRSKPSCVCAAGDGEGVYVCWDYCAGGGACCCC